MDGTVSGSHVYADNGEYTVTITVTDDDGGSTSDTLTMTVANVVPTLEPGADQIVDEGQLMSLDPATFNDPGTLDTHTATIDWGDGSPVDVGIVTESPFGPPGSTSGMDGTISSSHVYGDNGVFTVTIIVTDDDGGSDSAEFTVTVNNVAPTVSIAGIFEVDENSPLNLDGHATDPGSDDLTFSWDWGVSVPVDSSIYYNDGAGPDPFPSPYGDPMDVLDLVSHTYGDNGVFLVTLTVEDDDGGVTVVYTNITVNNVAPEIVKMEAFMYVNFTLRVAGEKWHSVGIQLLEDDSAIWAATVTRYPGDPDEQTATIERVKVDMTKSYKALVDYIPNDPGMNGNVWGGNPVWIITNFEDGSEERLHHTFNVRQSDWDSDHWNHIDPWEVEFTPQFGGRNITFEASVTDPGSDDLTFFWDFDDGTTSGPRTYFNDGVAPDPYPSPEIKPAEFSESLVYSYATPGTYNVSLTVTDDDGGVTVFIITLVTVI
jgi:PKD repeat protein